MYSKAKSTAIKLIKDYCITDPNEIPIEDLIYAQGAIFEEKPINGSDGRIMFGKQQAIITINSNIQNKNKRRFVIAHELGHLELHKHLQRFYKCDEKSFLEWHKTGSHEAEANEFAAELLMPTSIFKPEAAKAQFSIEHIINLSKKFNTSFTSTAIKYTQLGNEPIALIYSQAGKIKWYSKSDNFRCSYFKMKENVPMKSVAYDFFKNGQIPNDPEPILAHTWFNDFNLPQDQYFYEQCFKIPSQNGILSFIWECNDY